MGCGPLEMLKKMKNSKRRDLWALRLTAEECFQIAERAQQSSRLLGAPRCSPTRIPYRVNKGTNFPAWFANSWKESLAAYTLVKKKKPASYPTARAS